MKEKDKKVKTFKGKLKSMGKFKNNCELSEWAGGVVVCKKDRKKIKQDL